MGEKVIHSHRAHSFHTDIITARVTRCAVHHQAPVTEIEVLSFGDAVQLTLVLCWSRSDQMQTHEKIADNYAWEGKSIGKNNKM